ncbi:suppressor of glycerol defect, partial [Ascosphaera atra]
MPPRPRHSTTNLPRALREELGLPDKRDESRRQNGPMTRKERRKAERSRSKGHGNNAVTNQRQRQPAREHDNAPKAKRSSQPQEKKSSKRRASDEELPDVDLDEPDDLLSESDGEAMDVDGDEQKTSSERHISRAVQEKLDEDDAEIARLEKKLGIKGKKKLPKAFTDDGLDELLADLDVGFEDDDEVDENDEEGEEEEDDDGDDDEQQVSNEKHIPRTVREKLDEDDAEIARLEKLLGIKGKKKLPKAFAEDGLDELLGDMG